MAIKINIELEIDTSVAVDIDDQIIYDIREFLNTMIQRNDVLSFKTSRTYESPTAFCELPVKEKDND